MKYQIITSNSRVGIQEEIKDFLLNGWELHGSLCVVSNPNIWTDRDGDVCSDISQEFYQAMIARDPSEKPGITFLPPQPWNLHFGEDELTVENDNNLSMNLPHPGAGLKFGGH